VLCFVHYSTKTLNDGLQFGFGAGIGWLNSGSQLVGILFFQMSDPTNPLQPWIGLYILIGFSDAFLVLLLNVLHSLVRHLLHYRPYIWLGLSLLDVSLSHYLE
jgi:hypothetical protein